MLSQGATIAIVSKKIGVSDHTYYRWRKEYGGMRIAQAHRLRELEQEDARLKWVVADLALDNAILFNCGSNIRTGTTIGGRSVADGSDLDVDASF